MLVAISESPLGPRNSMCIVFHAHNSLEIWVLLPTFRHVIKTQGSNLYCSGTHSYYWQSLDVFWPLHWHKRSFWGPTLFSIHCSIPPFPTQRQGDFLGQTGQNPAKDSFPVISLACGHADRRKSDAQHRDTDWPGSGPLAQGNSAEMRKRRGLGSSCKEHVDSARLEGWLLQCGCLFITWTQMYICIDMYTHTQVFTCFYTHVYTHPQKHTHIHTCISVCLWLMRQGEESFLATALVFTTSELQKRISWGMLNLSLHVDQEQTLVTHHSFCFFKRKKGKS